MDQWMGGHAKWQAVAGKFYEGAMEPRQWDSGLMALAQASRARGAVLTLEDLGAGRSRVLHQAGQSLDAIRAYDEEFWRIAPLMRSAPEVPQGVWQDWMRRNPGHRRSPYYNEFLVPHGNYASIASVVWRDGNRFAAVGLQRTRDQGDFAAEDAQLLAPLMPHLTRAVRLYFATRELRERASLRAAVLDHVVTPVFVVDAQARVLMANTAAEDICRDAAQLTVTAGRLSSVADGAKLQAAIRGATSPRHPSGSFLRLPATLSKGAGLAVVAPLPASSVHCRAWQQPVAVVMANRMAPGAHSFADVLRTMFGVTAAEARVAHSFAEGLTINEIAERFGLQMETVRTQLKALFSKLGVRRQSELSRMLGGVQALLPQQRGDP